MNITRDEAVAALRDIEGVEERAKTARAYRFGAPHLILWGVIWVIGYTLNGLLPGHVIGWMWLVLTMVGVAGAMAFNRQRLRAMVAAGADERVARGRSRYWFASFLSVWLFVIATYVVMHPQASAQYQVYPALVIGLVYGVVGAWGQPRYLGIGGAVAALSLLGYFFLQPILPFWIAGVGGGGLILGGLWLRRP